MYSVIVWNIHEPISTSEMCLAVFFVILILGALGGKIGEAVLKWGFLGMNILNVGIVFFNAQMLFANFITNVLHESADLNYRTAIWQIVMAKIAESPVIGHREHWSDEKDSAVIDYTLVNERLNSFRTSSLRLLKEYLRRKNL